jgi:hypothetical protein
MAQQSTADMTMSAKGFIIPQRLRLAIARPIAVAASPVAARSQLPSQTTVDVISAWRIFLAWTLLNSIGVLVRHHCTGGRIGRYRAGW